MPRYNKQTELTRVNGHMIPAKSTHYAMGAKRYQVKSALSAERLYAMR